MNKYLLQLFVTGKSTRSQMAIYNLRHLFHDKLNMDYDLEIIDVLDRPDIAEKEKIIATPTLIKKIPPPSRRVIGDLSNAEKVLQGLGLALAIETDGPNEKGATS